MLNEFLPRFGGTKKKKKCTQSADRARPTKGTAKLQKGEGHAELKNYSIEKILSNNESSSRNTLSGLRRVSVSMALADPREGLGDARPIRIQKVNFVKIYIFFLGRGEGMVDLSLWKIFQKNISEPPP